MSSNGKFSFSFGTPKASTSGPKPKPVAQAPSAALFADDDDEDNGLVPEKPNVLAGPSRKKPAIQQSTQLSRAERKAQAAAEAQDQSIFDYDAHYDNMKAAERRQEEVKKAESEDQKPKYIEAFLAAAQTRKLDKLRAEEKMLEREREKEGDEFAGKEKFVTEAYKKQMEEVRKAEEEEKTREEAMRRGQSGTGMSAFYKIMLDAEEAKHAAAVAATSTPTIGPSLAIRPPPAAAIPAYDDEEEYDPLLAREAKQVGENQSDKAGSTRIDEITGKEVEINDDGEVVDKRSLLKAGLNIMKRPRVELPTSLTSSKASQPLAGPYVSKAVGTAASYKERMEREKRRLEQQYQEQEEKKRRDAEDDRRREEEEARKRREGDDGEAEKKRLEAKERFLARKRAREEGQKGGNKKAKE